MKEILTTVKGFSESDIKVMIDTDSQYTSPTGANIRKVRVPEWEVAESSVGSNGTE